jgi:serine/threonine protein kinase
VLEGKYRLLEELGRGGMGTVFRALDESLDRIVAVKFLLPEFQADEHLGDRFRREAKAMASVRHENVLQIFSFGSYGATSFFVMEYIEGVTAEKLLENAISRSVFLSLGKVLPILEQAASGLAAVHRAGVVHRDVKPANIMVEAETGRVVIMDFGIGKRYQHGETRRTQTPAGSPAYMAPEVVSGQQISSDEDYLSDIYAFGVTTFELLTNSLPFDSKNWVDILVKHVTEAPPTPSSRRPELQPELDAIVLKCLAKSPKERFQSCVELQRALLPLIPVEQHRSPTPVPAEVEPRKRPSSDGGAEPRRRHSSDGGAEPRKRPSVDLELPKRKPSRVRTAQTSTQTIKAVRVVVADQDLDFTRMAFEKVEEAFPGNRFQAAKSNAKAVELALTAPPLLMVARLDDPDLNGVELAATLRGHPQLRDVLLVLTSKRITAGERRMLQELGAYKVMLKPVDPDEFAKLLQTIAKRVESTVPHHDSSSG